MAKAPIPLHSSTEVIQYKKKKKMCFMQTKAKEEESHLVTLNEVLARFKRVKAFYTVIIKDGK